MTRHFLSENIIGLDICEDPELKARIAALRSEQESRARAGNQKTRRSQSTSTNTRTHSIRRNSTRDKGQISKRQIKNEAIFLLQDVKLHKDNSSEVPSQAIDSRFFLFSLPFDFRTSD